MCQYKIRSIKIEQNMHIFIYIYILMSYLDNLIHLHIHPYCRSVISVKRFRDAIVSLAVGKISDLPMMKPLPSLWSGLSSYVNEYLTP